VQQHGLTSPSELFVGERETEKEQLELVIFLSHYFRLLALRVHALETSAAGWSFLDNIQLATLSTIFQILLSIPPLKHFYCQRSFSISFIYGEREECCFFLVLLGSKDTFL